MTIEFTSRDAVNICVYTASGARGAYVDASAAAAHPAVCKAGPIVVIALRIVGQTVSHSNIAPLQFVQGLSHSHELIVQSNWPPTNSAKRVEPFS